MKKFAKVLLVIVALLVLAGYGIFQLPPSAVASLANGSRACSARPSSSMDGFQNTPPQNTDSSFWETVRLYPQGQIRQPQFKIPVIALSPAALRAAT